MRQSCKKIYQRKQNVSSIVVDLKKLIWEKARQFYYLGQKKTDKYNTHWFPIKNQMC